MANGVRRIFRPAPLIDCARDSNQHRKCKAGAASLARYLPELNIGPEYTPRHCRSPGTGHCRTANGSRFPVVPKSLHGGLGIRTSFAIRACWKEAARSVAYVPPGPVPVSRGVSATALNAACGPICLARSVWAHHLQSAPTGSIVRSAKIVIRPERCLSALPPPRCRAA